MSIPLVLLKFVGKAALNYVGFGVAGDFTIDVLPEVAKDVWKWWSASGDEARRRADLEALAQAPAAEIAREVKQVVEEVAGDQPPDVRNRLAGYLHLLPGVVHQSLRRPGDSHGLTVPPNTPLLKADDLLPFLPQRLPRFQPGQRPPGVGDWELVELLGVGGFGEVWKARNPRFDGVPPVALKFCLDPAARERLLTHEGAVLNQVMREGTKISGVVRLQHTYLSADPPCLEYEFVAGGDLAGLTHQLQKSKGGLSADQAARILYRLARTMGQVHHLHPPIVHRDLKPANILVQRLEGGKVNFRIADFGIGGVAASQAIEQARRTNSGQYMMTALLGSHTPLYASPQQMSGLPPDPRDDVHALGVIWYQLLVGDLSRGAPRGRGWRKRLEENGASVAALDLMEECFEEDLSLRLTDAAVLADRLGALLKAAPAAISAAASPAVSQSAAAQAALEIGPSPASTAAAITAGGPETARGLAETMRPPDDPKADEETAPEDEPSAPAPAGTTAETLLAEGSLFLDGGEYAKAVRAFTRAVKLDPGNVSAYVRRAEAYQARGEYDKAFGDLGKIVGLEPRNPDGYIRRARCRRECGEHDKAVQDATRAIQLDTRSAAAYTERGRAYTAKEAYDLAFADFNEALRLDAASAEAYLARGHAHYLRDENEQAVSDFNEGMRLLPGDARFRNARGLVYYFMGQLDAAVADFIEAVRLDPGNAEAYFNRGRAYAEKGNDEQAVADFTQSIQLNRGVVVVYQERGLANARLGRRRQAFADFNQAIKLDPRDPLLYLARGEALADDGEHEKAIDDFKEALRLNRDSVDAHLQRGMAYLFTGKFGRAIADLSRVIELDPEITDAYRFRSCAYCQKGQFDEAAADATEAIRRDPASDAAFNSRAHALAGKGLFEQALADVSEAIRLDPEYADYYNTRGLIHHSRGDFLAAIAEFTEAIRREPKEAETYRNRARSYDMSGQKDRAQADRAKAVKLNPGPEK